MNLLPLHDTSTLKIVSCRVSFRTLISDHHLRTHFGRKYVQLSVLKEPEDYHTEIKKLIIQ